MYKVNEAIRKKRKELHMPMEVVADAIGMCRTTYSKKEKEGDFYVQELDKICDFFDISLPHLVSGLIVPNLSEKPKKNGLLTFSQNTSRLDALFDTSPSSLTEEEMVLFNIIRTYNNSDSYKKLLEYAKFIKHNEDEE